MVQGPSQGKPGRGRYALLRSRLFVIKCLWAKRYVSAASYQELSEARRDPKITMKYDEDCALIMRLGLKAASFVQQASGSSDWWSPLKRILDLMAMLLDVSVA